MDSHVTSVIAFPWLPFPLLAYPCAIVTDMPATAFFWHDHETFGIVPRRDRPVQSAGLRTDR